MKDVHADIISMTKLIFDEAKRQTDRLLILAKRLRSIDGPRKALHASWEDRMRILKTNFGPQYACLENYKHEECSPSVLSPNEIIMSYWVYKCSTNEQLALRLTSTIQRRVVDNFLSLHSFKASIIECLCHVMDYEDYLKTTYWKRRREDAIKRAGERCTLCSTTICLQVHHNNYSRRGFEWPEDLTVTCGKCHKKHHGVER